MKARDVCFLALAGVGAGVLGACTTQDYSDTTCGGYLGCSAGVKIGPPEAKITTTGAAGSGGPAGSGGAAGATGAGGAPATGINAVLKGPGCGKDLPANTIQSVPGTPKGYTRYSVMGTGANLTATVIAAKQGERTFWVRVPVDYDPNKAYRVIYVGQGCGGFDSANTNTLPLFKESLGGTEQAIYVALDIPKDMANMDCYDNRDGLTSQEWEAFELFHKVVDANYCVDNNRVYVSGYSTGGWLSNMWGCYFAGNPTPPRKFGAAYHIRAQAAVTGGEPAVQPLCSGPVAAIWIHDTLDTGNPISGTYEACARVLKMNKCTNVSRCEDVNAMTTPWHHEIPMLDVCAQFSGCPTDYPVVLCKTAGLGHADQAARATAAFNAFFNMLPPP
jgi:hypothetical protein